MTDLAAYIRDIPDFPKPGIIFKDITPMVGNHDALVAAADQLADLYRDTKVDAVAGIEARGFIFGPMLAERLGVGFIPVRKAGKLPYKKIARSYGLEYGKATIEVHSDAVAPGQRVLMVDDLLATGGTMAAACELIEDLGGEIAGCAFVVELAFLPGREKLKKYDDANTVKTLLTYNGE
jgi:adenine phosphoribosyltransferase